MNMQPNLLEPMDLPGFKVETSANTGSDPMTNAHMKNWMEVTLVTKEAECRYYGWL